MKMQKVYKINISKCQTYPPPLKMKKMCFYMFQAILSIFKIPVKRLGSGWTPPPPSWEKFPTFTLFY